ncbi:MAG: RNA 2',3'-cyclic phosphodiesterase [Proteobacteria bacterium]|nr:RNA 2',3'-cyclic phosphodiesterase [Pseudomonadota bacterium]
MRLFVGIALPGELRARLSALRGGLKGARWVAEANLHLSLRFIGEITGGFEADIDAALQPLRVPAFSLTVAGLGAFERRGRVHAVWAGVEKSDALMALHEKIESALVRAGLEPEHRKFKPHVTLARLNGGSAADAGLYIETHAAFAAAPFVVDRVTLFESHLGHGGSHYVALADYPPAPI